MKPTIGRIVIYILTEEDARQIAMLSGRKNSPAAGQEYPAMVVRRWGPDPASAVQLQVFYDGDGSYWATSRVQGEKPGTWHWPEREG